MHHLRGSAVLRTSEMELRADEVDYDEASGLAEARGSVFYKNFARNEELTASRAEYSLKDETGRFYDVKGTSAVKIDARPGVLTSSNPFYFEGKWADRIGSRYVLHDGMITNCRLPNPWWTLRGPSFDIVPDERAIARGATFRVRKIPLFYAPFFYKSLQKAPRKSGFLTPNIGNSSRRGLMFGAGYYWAINRSYDVMYRSQLFTQRGFAHHVDLRGKPRHGTDFNVILYGVNDRGLLLQDGSRRKEGGYILSTSAQSDLGRGFYGKAEINYLSSLAFRQAFTESFQEAIFSETNSTGFVGKHWSTYSFNAAFSRLQSFQTLAPGDWVLIRRLPEISFTSRDRQIRSGSLPLWVSFDTSLALLDRSQLSFRTSQFMNRLDASPRVTTAVRWKDIHLIPSFSIRETRYAESREERDGAIVRRNLVRHAHTAEVEAVLPSLARTFRRKSFLGDQVKHVIEPRVTFRHTGGVTDFERVIRFDPVDLVSNTTEAEISLTNRVFAKRQGQVSEVLSWELWHKRFFDPTFGGALIPGERNIVSSGVGLTPYAFLDEPRRYSPIVSVVRVSPLPAASVQWRSDYDPLRQRFVNSTIQADVRQGDYFGLLGHNHVRSNPRISPSANQLFGVVGRGKPSSKGWNTGFTAIYDFRLAVMQFAQVETAYNTDCCGFSVQYRRFSFGNRNENQFRLAFAIANIGSFGTLRRQERIF
ncbi:MAG: LPS-assembly protein LptD [Bryobacterales bacterium]|nr:LPS-assembly protein LptD [Bryobacterales bacterium]